METYKQQAKGGGAAGKGAGVGGGEESEDEDSIAEGNPPPDVDLGALTPEQEHQVMKNVVSRMLKPEKTYGEGAARLFEHHIRSGVSLKAAGPLIANTLLLSTGVHLKNDLKMTMSRNTIKLYSVGITRLDGEELVKAILAAPFLLVAGDESLRNGDKKFPIFVAFHDVATDSPWWGPFRICNMKDKTAETQAHLFFDTIVNILKYPRERVLFVLSDNTASVSSEEGGCVALLQRKLRGEDTTAKVAKRGRGPAKKGTSQAARGGGASGSAGAAGAAATSKKGPTVRKKRAAAKGDATPASAVAAAAGGKGKSGKGKGKGKGKAKELATSTRQGSRVRRAPAKLREGAGGSDDDDDSSEES